MSSAKDYSGHGTSHIHRPVIKKSPIIVNVNGEMREFMRELIHEENIAKRARNVHFNDDRCAKINKSLKNKDNNYTLDKYGLIIRKGSYEKRSDPFGWRNSVIDGLPVHVRANESITNQDDIFKGVIEIVARDKRTSRAYEIVYSDHFPERMCYLHKNA